MSEGADPLVALTAQVVAAYVRNHSVAPEDLPALMKTVRHGLERSSEREADAPTREPAVPVEKSITDTHLICLEDGKPFQSLKRHLRVAFDLSPEEYRARWGLPDDYPMVAPAYARRRSALAKKTGLGRGSRAGRG